VADKKLEKRNTVVNAQQGTEQTDPYSVRLVGDQFQTTHALSGTLLTLKVIVDEKLKLEHTLHNSSEIRELEDVDNKSEET
jgi:hypothetical protein